MSTTGLLRRLSLDVGELVERHERAQDVGQFLRYGEEPVAFIRTVLKGEPWEKQLEIAGLVHDHPLVVVRSCNAAGKDWIAAQLALWWVYARGGLVLVTGPTERQVKEIVMGHVRRAFHGSDLPGELYQMALRIPGSEPAGILAFTSTESAKLTGFHAPRVMAVLTEAQALEDYAWEGLLACTTGQDDRMLAVGNPLSPSGRFYTASQSRAWARLRISAEECPNVREGRTVIPGGMTREAVERFRSEYGTDSPIFRARVEGEFPDQGVEGLIARSWLEEAARKHESGALAEEAENAEPLVAVDPARLGPDQTVLGVRRGSVLQELVGWGRADTMVTVGRIGEVLLRVGVRRSYPINGYQHHYGRVVVDTVGVGGGVTDRLRELEFRVVAFNGGQRARNPKRFANVRAESYWHLGELLENAKIALPPDEALFDELCAVQWRPNSSGQIQMEAKDDLRSRLGRSPDRADAVVMAFSPSVKRGVPDLPPLRW